LIKRYFTKDGDTIEDVFKTVKWNKTIAEIKDISGKILFYEPEAEFPDTWSQNSINIVSSKYFCRGDKSNGEIFETSLKQIITRIVNRFSEWATIRGCFTSIDIDIFKTELAYIMLHQYAVFNTPVLINVGAKKGHEQCSACFILDVEDSLESITEWWKTETLIFRDGSGSGVSLHKLRGKGESLSGGGTSSGPVSFSRVADTSAGVTKSAGKNRRAAKIVVLNDTHPDLEEFISCKTKEELKAHALINAGYSPEEAYESVYFQNANNSVSVTDKFMSAAINNEKWNLISPKTNKIISKTNANKILDLVSKETWKTGDPGLIFYDTVNSWHTCARTNPIVSPNPCLPGWVSVIRLNHIDGTSEIVPLSSLKIGDKIWSSHGWTTVTNFFENGVKQVYEYKTNHGSLYCTEDHRVVGKPYEKVEAKNATYLIRLAIPNEKILNLKEDHDFIQVQSFDEIYDMINDGSNTIISRKEHSIEDVYDITVDNKSHTFWCNGFDISNCSEYFSLTSTSCNLICLNLLKFYTNNKFNLEEFNHVIDIMYIASNLLIEYADYPTEKIKQGTLSVRNIGMGFTNLGALITNMCYSYNSVEARSVAANLASIMTARCYGNSGEMVKLGYYKPFPLFEDNKQCMIYVLKKHKLKAKKLTGELGRIAAEMWDETLKYDSFCNSQVTVMMPAGCLESNTMILTADGYLPIEDIGDIKGDKIQSININVMQETGTRQATKFFINGVKPVIKIETSNGREIIGTPDHKIRVINENGEYVWKELKELKNDDVVPILIGGHEKLLKNKKPVKMQQETIKQHVNSNKLIFPKYLDHTTATILGLYMGNGYLKNKSGLCFVICDKDRDVDSFIEKWSKTINSCTKIEQSIGCHKLIIYSNDLTRWFNENRLSKPIGNNGEGSVGAFIPLKVLQSNTKTLCSFLSGLFESDGTVHKTKETIHVEYCSTSKKLAYQVFYCLESLGIMSTIHKQENKQKYNRYGTRPTYRVRILNRNSVKEFYSKIGFISERKQSILSQVLNKSNGNGEDFKKETIKHKMLLSELHNLSKKYKINSGEISDINIRKNKNSANLFWLNKIYDKHEKLRSARIFDIIKNKNMRFVNITKISNVEDSQTYDLTVPLNNTYLANGFVSHNTVSYWLGADTTGIEPEISLIKQKILSGGGILCFLNNNFFSVLSKLEYDKATINNIKKHLEKNEAKEAFALIKSEHKSIFETSLGTCGEHILPYAAHIDMVAAIQPHISGGLSKTVNVPNETTQEEIKNIYITAWKKGLKSVSIYRDNSKMMQPMVAASKKTNGNLSKKIPLPEERQSITHSVTIAGQKIYFTVGLYDNGLPGEVYIVASKEGSFVSGALDALAKTISLSLQRGTPIEVITRKLKGMSFEPYGITTNSKIRTAKSVVDYMAKWLELKFVSGVEDSGQSTITDRFSGPICTKCGSFMVMSGSCYTCTGCGDSSGCA